VLRTSRDECALGSVGVSAYTQRWYDEFLRGVPPEQTEREADFLERVVPRGRVLDVCCGLGRHLRALEARGYECVGVELEPRLVAEAPAAGLDVRELDMRDVGSVEGEFEGVLSMWASFGWFDDETNAEVLRRLAAKVAEGGRLVLDVWMPEFFETHHGTREIRPGIVETKSVRDGRLYVEYDYGEGFDWRLYEPEELAPLVGLDPVRACSDWTESQPPSPDVPRYQLVLERRARTARVYEAALDVADHAL